MELEYKVEQIPLDDIFLDNSFNCRGRISPIDVTDLMKSIDTEGLRDPITVQSYTHLTNKRYRVICGHRRYTAFKLLKKATIPCYVRNDLDDIKARTMNLKENLERKNLNMLQEAHGIRDYKAWGFTQQDTANLVGQSLDWVRIRFMILDFPSDIQEEIAAGVLNQTQIRDISRLPLYKKYEVVKTIKEAKERGEKVNIKQEQKKKNPYAMRERKKHELYRLKHSIMNSIGACLATRVLAWATADISDWDVQNEIKKAAEEAGKEYEIPEEFQI